MGLVLGMYVCVCDCMYAFVRGHAFVRVGVVNTYVYVYVCMYVCINVLKILKK